MPRFLSFYDFLMLIHQILRLIDSDLQFMYMPGAGRSGPCLFCSEVSLVSPLGQGTSYLYHCIIPLKNLDDHTLFSPLERGQIKNRPPARSNNRQWLPGWAPPVRLAKMYVFFSFPK